MHSSSFLLFALAALFTPAIAHPAPSIKTGQIICNPLPTSLLAPRVNSDLVKLIPMARTNGQCGIKDGIEGWKECFIGSSESIRVGVLYSKDPNGKGRNFDITHLQLVYAAAEIALECEDGGGRVGGYVKVKFDEENEGWVFLKSGKDPLATVGSDGTLRGEGIVDYD